MVEVINAIQKLNKEQLEAIEFEVRVALMEMEVANE
tara:strand:- start:520 stop:627 length:108 start_codon:yes stop_codon:yes gene_type:complete